MGSNPRIKLSYIVDLHRSMLLVLHMVSLCQGNRRYQFSGEVDARGWNALRIKNSAPGRW